MKARSIFSTRLARLDIWLSNTPMKAITLNGSRTLMSSNYSRYLGSGSKTENTRAGAKSCATPVLSDFGSGGHTPSIRLSGFASDRTSGYKSPPTTLRSTGNKREREPSPSSHETPPNDSYQWVCDACKRTIVGKSIRHLSSLRDAHRRQQHPKMCRKRFHTHPEYLHSSAAHHQAYASIRI